MKPRLHLPQFRYHRSISTGAQSVSEIFASHPLFEPSLLNKQRTRPPNLLLDHLSPTNSHLLNVSLTGLLPESCHPLSYNASHPVLPTVSASKTIPSSVRAALEHRLPQGHHLVYFPPTVPPQGLNPEDGTDNLHSPGPPFVRRLWAGGSLSFNPALRQQLDLSNGRVVCVEGVRNVTVKGLEEDQKVFVDIDRCIRALDGEEDGEAAAERDWLADGADLKERFSIVERRTLVFMKKKSPEMASRDALKVDRVVKPLFPPDFSVALTPDPTLLFRFSALTFNAHKIHLDKTYSRTIEGHRNLLVHGPLSLVLMLSVLRSQLPLGDMVRSFTYRNLAPLYAEEQMTVCVRRMQPASDGSWDVWITGRDGGYAVKGSAVVGPVDVDRFKLKYYANSLRDIEVGKASRSGKSSGPGPESSG